MCTLDPPRNGEDLYAFLKGSSQDHGQHVIYLIHTNDIY